MAIDPEELLPRKPKFDIVIGEDLYAWSVSELEKRIVILEGELARVRETLKSRAVTKSAADSVFKR